MVSCVHGLEELILLKMSILLKAVYRFNEILFKFPMVFCTEIAQTILKLIWNHKKFWITKAFLQKTKQEASCFTFVFKLNSKAIVIKTVQSWQEAEKMDQWNRIESPQTNLSTDLPQLMMRIHSNKPISWKYLKSKINLICPTCLA